MRVHVLQHVPFEGLGSIGHWLSGRNATISHTRFYQAPALPDPADFDLIVAMGGPMSVNDEATLPWLVAEKRFLRTAIERNAAVLGICLGAQLIASAMGSRIYPGPQREIGWFDIEAVDGEGERFRFPARARVFHWHGETLDLPAGAIHLARSAACENQAYQLGRRTIGLQFHLETTPASADAIISNCRDELVEAPYVQDEQRLRAAGGDDYARINRMMAEVLDYITGQ